MSENYFPEKCLHINTLKYFVTFITFGHANYRNWCQIYLEASIFAVQLNSTLGPFNRMATVLPLRSEISDYE